MQCPDCGAIGPRGPNMERAAVRWNNRKGRGLGRLPRPAEAICPRYGNGTIEVPVKKPPAS